MSTDKQQTYEVIYNVDLGKDQKGDIITFYNQLFISTIKSFIMNLNKKSSKNFNEKSQTPSIKNPLISKKIMDSPISVVLPSGLQSMKKNLNPKNSIMTPKTHMLYAFSESPLMKIPENNLKKKTVIHSKKLINFEEPIYGGKVEEKNFSKYENEQQLGKIYETNCENSSGIKEKMNSKITFLYLISLIIVQLKIFGKPENSGRGSPEKNKTLVIQSKNCQNDTQKFLKNLSTNIQEMNKTPKTKNKFAKLNFENVQGNVNIKP